jgi:hypothetical protein
VTIDLKTTIVINLELIKTKFVFKQVYVGRLRSMGPSMIYVLSCFTLTLAALVADDLDWITDRNM